MAIIKGTGLSEFLSGTEGNDVIVGNGGSDYLLGFGGIDHLITYDGEDTLEGGTGDDFLESGAGNDKLEGGDGNDVLIGVSYSTGDIPILNPGRDEIDTLVGGAGKDRFTLGDGLSGLYYNDTSTTVGKDNDYAVIADFTDGQDVINVGFSSEKFRLTSVTKDGISGIGIFIGTGRGSNFVKTDLIGIVQGAALSELTFNKTANGFITIS